MSTPDLRDKLDGIHHFNKLEAIYPENLSRHPSSRVPTNKVRSSDFLLIPMITYVRIYIQCLKSRASTTSNSYKDISNLLSQILRQNFVKSKYLPNN